MRRVKYASVKRPWLLALTALASTAVVPVASADGASDNAEQVLLFFQLLALQAGPDSSNHFMLRGSGLDAEATSRLVEHAKKTIEELGALSGQSRARTCLQRSQLQTRAQLDQQLLKEEAWVEAERVKKADVSAVLTVDQQALFRMHLGRFAGSSQGLGSLDQMMEGKSAQEYLSMLRDYGRPWRLTEDRAA